MIKLTQPRRLLFLFFSLVFFLFPWGASGADFYLFMDGCATVAGLLGHSDEGNIKVLKGEPLNVECSRVSEKMVCQLHFQNGVQSEKGNHVVYQIKLDSPPHLHFTDENFSDYYAINTSQHAVVLITRMMTDVGIGSKVCHGMYITESERKALMKE